MRLHLRTCSRLLSDSSLAASQAIFARHNAQLSTTCRTADNCSNGIRITIRPGHALWFAAATKLGKTDTRGRKCHQPSRKRCRTALLPTACDLTATRRSWSNWPTKWRTARDAMRRARKSASAASAWWVEISGPFACRNAITPITRYSLRLSFCLRKRGFGTRRGDRAGISSRFRCLVKH